MWQTVAGVLFFALSIAGFIYSCPIPEVRAPGDPQSGDAPPPDKPR